MKVIIAEKPSVAKNIADALGIRKRQDGYFEGEGYLISWAFGHLLELYDAKDYEEKRKFWRMEYFPFCPDKFEYKVKLGKNRKGPDPGAKKQLNCIKKLINREDVDAVISACDYDREGQIIADIIFAYLKVKKPIYRMLLNEWTEEEVKKGIAGMVLNRQLKPLQDAGISRQHADWLIGINLTSVATLKYGGKGEVLNIGRVLLPTLKMIYDKDMEIENFKEEPYYKLNGTFKNGDIVYEGTYTVEKQEKKEDKFGTQEELDAVKQAVLGKVAVLDSKEVVEKNEYPPVLFNLSSLQGYITSKYQGFTSDKVLKLAQSLYEKKYITYPRTASTVLDESLVDKVKKVLFTLKKGLPYEEEVRFQVTKRVFNSQKVESHSAIIPTYMIPRGLGREEELVYNAVKERFIMQFMPIARVEETTMITKVPEAAIEGVFVSKGKVQKELGWKKVTIEESKDTLLPDIAEGFQTRVDNIDITFHTTKPPKPHTEKTLLRAMETCGRQFKEDDGKDGDKEDVEMMDAILSGFSIGTPATRAETIKKLQTAGYTMMQRKNIRCTPKGKYLIETLPVKELMDLEYTGRLEKTLSDIEKGVVSKNEFMNHILQFVWKAVGDIKTQAVSQRPIATEPAPGTAKKAGTSQGKAAAKPKTPAKPKESTGEREVLGKCPVCGAEVVEGAKGFGCMGFKDGCKFVIWKEDGSLARFGKKVNKTMVKALLKKGIATVKGLKDSKGNKFDGEVIYQRNPQTGQFEWGIRKI